MRITGRCVLIASIIIICNSWGFLVHRTVHQLAIYELPGSLQRFMYHHMEYGVRYSVRPDQRRSQDSTEAAKHYIDFEEYGDSAAWKMPWSWTDAVARYTPDSLLKHGYVPYYVIMMKNRLTQAFRSGNADSVLILATELAHYIGDAHVPLHTTVNYDGQLTGQKGLHALWESTIPEMLIDQFTLSSPHKAKYIRHPEQAIWNAVRHSYSMVDEILKTERTVSASFTDNTKYRVQTRNGREVKSYTSAFAKAYNKALGHSINDQLIRTANMIADFWYTAWVDAGKPDMDNWYQPAFSDDDQKKLKTETKAFRKNELLLHDLLIARKRGKNRD
jgi:hypothetical protein